MDFSLGSSFLSSPQVFISVQPSLIGQAALMVWALHSRSKKTLPSLPRLVKLGCMGMHRALRPPPGNWLGWQRGGWGGRQSCLNMSLAAAEGMGDGRGELQKRGEVIVSS